MQDQLNALRLEAAEAVTGVKNLNELISVEIEFLGRKGKFTAILKTLAQVPVKDRARFGALANQNKNEIQALIASRRRELEEARVYSLSEAEREDVTEPGIRPPEGHLHIVSQAICEITAIFEKIGFTRTRYPEVDWDWYAFESLNMPPDHPARDEWETFFLDAPISNDSPSSRLRGVRRGRMVLTPHTSNSQVRELERGEFPVRMINIAKCYRRQSDATHVPMFHQFEGLYVDKGVSIAHLCGVLDYFAKVFFGPKRKTRLRPFHFRFTEPSFEIDVSCGVCGGTGIGADKQKCRVCKRGWLELGGAGMVHPNVLKAGKVDPKKYSGFAFGWGVERTYMMKEGMQIDDIRILYKNDLRFLKQF